MEAIGRWKCVLSTKVGTPGRVRTCGLQLRRLSLYPSELRAHSGECRARAVAPVSIGEWSLTEPEAFSTKSGDPVIQVIHASVGC